MINIINKHSMFYVGRGSPLGNQYVIGEHGSREEVIAKYEVWLEEQIRTKNKEVCDELNKMVKAYKTYKELSLLCYCSPMPCHAEIVAGILEDKLFTDTDYADKIVREIERKKIER